MKPLVDKNFYRPVSLIRIKLKTSVKMNKKTKILNCQEPLKINTEGLGLGFGEGLGAGVGDGLGLGYN